MMEKIISKVTFDGRFEDREHVVRRFVRHTEQVKERVPPEKLLVYEVGEGWQPLCDFLGAEVPRGKPFPRLNDRQTLPKMMRRHMVAALAPRAVRVIATVSVLLAAAWALRSAVRSPRRRAG